MPSHIVDPIRDFTPSPRSPCVCGSRKKFLDCCGSEAPDRGPPRKVILKPAFLDHALCDKLVSYALRQSGSELEIYSNTDESGTPVKREVNADRVSSRVDLGSKQATVDGWVSRIMHEMLAPLLKTRIRDYTQPDLMRYDIGGYYKAHADSEIFDPKTGTWSKVLDRDYSLLLYLNDDYVGGGLKFVHFNYYYKPGKGDLLLFPSDNLYLHEAEPVTAGTKLVVVSWAATGKVP